MTSTETEKASVPGWLGNLDSYVADIRDEEQPTLIEDDAISTQEFRQGIGNASRKYFCLAGDAHVNDARLPKEKFALQESNSLSPRTAKTPLAQRHCANTPKSSVRKSRLPMSEAKARGISFSLFRTPPKTVGHPVVCRPVGFQDENTPLLRRLSFSKLLASPGGLAEGCVNDSDASMSPKLQLWRPDNVLSTDTLPGAIATPCKERKTATMQRSSSRLRTPASVKRSTSMSAKSNLPSYSATTPVQRSSSTSIRTRPHRLATPAEVKRPLSTTPKPERSQARPARKNTSSAVAITRRPGVSGSAMKSKLPVFHQNKK